MAKRTTQNRLANETSTYLLQHANNPVDWYPWCEEALNKSKEENKPILLSIGYAACHWCHVMEHESFEDADTALIMNEQFVNIKVDREERTDLDEIYMKAVQLMTGHGGWPMTVFLTPELKPIFAGTYFPPDDRHGMPSFKKILLGVSRAWEEKREDVLKSADEITEHLVKFETIGDRKPAVDVSAEESSFDLSTVESAFSTIYRYFDDVFGGIGSAPKFPQPFCLSLALKLLSMEKIEEDTKTKAREFIQLTLDKMAFGGIHDHFAGGFARYSVDRKWIIPHFEKMLYDNALLCSIYFTASKLMENKYWSEVASGIIEFVYRELTTDEGVFYSSLDADSDGVEGEFYVWTPDQIKEILDESDAEIIIKMFGITESGNFEEGKSNPNLLKEPAEYAKDFDMEQSQFLEKIDQLKSRLLSEREKRVRPGLDEKVLTSWNSLMISALVTGYKIDKNEKYLERAQKAASFILNVLVKDDRVLRTWGKGTAKLNGYLDDYSYLVQALLDLSEIDPDPKWLDKSIELTDSMLKYFWDEKNGGFFYTSSDHEKLVIRTKSHFDGAVPSGASVAASNLFRLSKITDNKDYDEKARTVIGIYNDIMAKRPEQFSNLLSTLCDMENNSREIVIMVDSKKDDWQEALFEIHQNCKASDIVLVSDAANNHKEDIKLLEGRNSQNGTYTVYVCENYTCKEPVSDIEKLRSVL